MKKIFIDGSAGTTGLRIAERLESRKDIEIIKLSEENRKDTSARKEAINKADIVFLCFPAWDGTIPMALCTFLEDYDMRDKAVIPVIYGTDNELMQAMADINAVTPQTMLINGYHFTTDLEAGRTTLEAWVDSVLYG